MTAEVNRPLPMHLLFRLSRRRHCGAPTLSASRHSRHHDPAFSFSGQARPQPEMRNYASGYQSHCLQIYLLAPSLFVANQTKVLLIILHRTSSLHQVFPREPHHASLVFTHYYLCFSSNVGQMRDDFTHSFPSSRPPSRYTFTITLRSPRPYTSNRLRRLQRRLPPRYCAMTPRGRTFKGYT